MGVLRGIGRFFYDLVIGDDWKIAVAVVAALALGAALVTQTSASWLAPAAGALIMAAFTVALVIDTRRR